MKTERKENLERGYCHITLKEHKIISGKYHVQGLTVYLVFMLSRLLSRWSLNKELESLLQDFFVGSCIYYTKMLEKLSESHVPVNSGTAFTAVPAYKDEMG